MDYNATHNNFLKKKDFNHYKEVHLYFYTYINSELNLLLHKSNGEDNIDYYEIKETIQPNDNTAPFALARTMATKYRGLFRQSNIDKMAAGDTLTEKDINESSEYIWYQIWNNEVFIEFLDKLAMNPIQYDNIDGKLIYFLELPLINVNQLNENLIKINYEYTFIYKRYTFNSDGNGSNLLNYFDFNSHIQNTIKLHEDDLLDYYVILSCKPAGSVKDQAGFFHFPALFTGLYRKNGEKWIYLVTSMDELPNESILKKCKAVIIPGSHLHVYDNYEFLRKTEEWIRDLIHNWPKIKYLGICFGFQILCDALGGKTESMGNGLFVTGGEEISFDENFWKFNFVKSSGVDYNSTLTISQAHGDHVPLLPEYEKYKLKNYASSKSCGTEIVISDDERILCFQGHPEYSPHFSISRIAPLHCKMRKIEENSENFNKIRDEFLSQPKNAYENSVEFRKFCNSFLKLS